MNLTQTKYIADIRNAIAIVADFFYYGHDWIFTEQYVDASLNLPIIIKLFEEDGDG